MPTHYPIQQFQQLDTPFYYYDMQLLDDTLSAIKQAIGTDANYHVHYAIKANAHPALLQRIASYGFGADCVSGGEVSQAIQNGFPHHTVVFAGVGKSDKEIRLALQQNIACFNVESMPELENISRLAVEMGVEARVAFRVNPNVDAHTHEKITTGLSENKFGISIRQLVPAIQRAQQLPAIRYVGLHFHIGSQITDMHPFEQLCQAINEIQDMLEVHGIVTSSINVGGGLGISYDHPCQQPIPNFKGYIDTYRTHLKLRSHQQLHFELGRSVVAQCGNLIARVLYVKEGEEKKFAILDAGMTDLIRPAMYGALHQLQNLTSAGATSPYDVVGPVCESSDTFATAYPLPVTQRGDLIAILSAGAYGATMASRYNLRELPASVLSTELF